MSKRKFNTYNRRLAHAAIEIFTEEGDNFVTPDDLHKKLYGHKCPSQAVRKDIRRRLSKIKALLHREYSMPVFLVKDVCELPKTMMEARRNIAGRGYGAAANAIGRVNGPATQMMYIAEKEHYLACGSGLMRHQAEDVIEACAADCLPEARGTALLKRAHKSAEPKQLSGAGKKAEQQMLPAAE